jgi:hypothetical protein
MENGYVIIGDTPVPMEELEEKIDALRFAFDDLFGILLGVFIKRKRKGLRGDSAVSYFDLFKHPIEDEIDFDHLAEMVKATSFTTEEAVSALTDALK